jgi:peptidoglycan/LPS O-acetylase OafA/YrhL
LGLFLGLFSYSIYLMHGPILGLFERFILNPMNAAPLARFAVLLFVAIPVVLVVCYGFYLMFEAPFLAHRDASAFRAMPIVRAARRLRRWLGFEPVASAPEVTTPGSHASLDPPLSP